MRIALLILLFALNILTSFAQIKQPTPVSTQLTIAKANVYNENNEIANVFFVTNAELNKTGTGFLIRSGHIITCEHVVHGASLGQIGIQGTNGVKYAVRSVLKDTVRDLAIITLFIKLPGGFELGNDDKTLIGHQVFTWGYPSGYPGPSPLLSVGFVAGMKVRDVYPILSVKHFVVNGAFNPGNSGGALIDSGKVIGIVQSKADLTSAFVNSSIAALNANQSGFIYNRTNIDGTVTQVTEGQIIAGVLENIRSVAQVMIGEAVVVSELKQFLIENKINTF